MVVVGRRGRGLGGAERGVPSLSGTGLKIQDPPQSRGKYARPPLNNETFKRPPHSNSLSQLPSDPKLLISFCQNIQNELFCQLDHKQRQKIYNG